MGGVVKKYVEEDVINGDMKDMLLKTNQELMDSGQKVFMLCFLLFLVVSVCCLLG